MCVQFADCQVRTLTTFYDTQNFTLCEAYLINTQIKTTLASVFSAADSLARPYLIYCITITPQ